MSKQSPKVFLLGYGGANNTGAEIRILTIIDDVRAAFGPHVEITLGTVDREKTLRVLGEEAGVHVVQLPYVFPLAVWRLTRRHDIVILVEGSTFKDNWSSALLYLFLWGAWTAHRHGNLTVAYAVDAGRMSALNQRLTRWVCDKIDLIITRTAAAREQLRALGVRRDIAVTTDTAFQFSDVPAAQAATPVVGLAPVEFYQWPVRFQLWGRKEHCYHWPYYFTWNEERLQRSASLVDAWVALATDIVCNRGWRVQLIAMEQLDTAICQKILDKLPPSVREHVDTSFAGEQPPQAIVRTLRGLNYLATSRYHACVLSMAGKVPQMALYHDERLISIYKEIGIEHYALSYAQADIASRLRATFDDMVDNADGIADRLDERLQSYFMPRCMENRELLRQWHRQLAPAAGSAS